MKGKLFLCILVVALASLSCVNGENVTAEDWELNATYGFNDLQTDIDSCDLELNLTHDYEFLPTDDFGIDLYRDISINGNGHIIDAKGGSLIFNAIASKISICNLTLKNGQCAISAIDCDITTRNVIFANNSNEDLDGGAVSALTSYYTSVNDIFIDNMANYGSAICVEEESVLELNNATFKSGFDVEWGLIAARYSEVRIKDTAFSNITSRYSTILYGTSVKGSVKNSVFSNLHADKTAGAIAVKGVEKSFTIDKCSFINCTSRKNGGALYIDLISEDMGEFDLDHIDSTVYLKNSKFTNCASKFGGAYLQLNGNLNIKNCIFKNNTGNAGYTSYADCKISKSVFEDNPEGSLYFDKSTLKISNSRFNSNGKAYIQDSKYTISSSIFNNTNLYSRFDEKKCSIADTTFTDSKVRVNMKKSTEVICNDLSKIENTKEKTFPSNTINKKYFNLRDYGLVSSVKDQGASGSCWVFATVSAFESALLKVGIDIDISENSVYNAALQYSPVGVEYLFEGGESIFATQYFLSWLDIITEEEDDYDELGRISGVAISNDHPHYSANTVKFEYDIKDVKRALVDYGALFVPVYMDYDYISYMNMSNYAFYNSKHSEQTHAVNIVGWNDSYSKYNFKKTPPKDGAWIIKNSWGDEWGDGGYYYMSYYDLSLDSFEVLGFEISPEIYDKIYQHDYFSNYFENEAGFYVDGADKITYAQTYTSNGDELISAVGTYFAFAGNSYTVKILLNGNVVHTQHGLSKHEGFSIIKLTSPVCVGKNEKFTIEIERSDMAYGFISRAKYNTKNSYYKIGNKKYSITDEIPVVKAYTTKNTIKSKNLVNYYAKSKVRYTISNISGKKITIKVDKKKYTVKIKNNTAKLKLHLKKGSHKITTYYKGKKIINQILIKSTIKTKETVKIHHNTKKTLKIKFLDSKGKILKKRKITFKLNSKTFIRKTDKNGILNIPLPGKLKKGRYHISLTNPKTGEKAKTTVKII